MRLKALRLPSPSQMAMHIGLPISAAFLSAAATMRCAASLLMLDFVNVFSVIELPVPP
jgi:hypothetical protein